MGQVADSVDYVSELQWLGVRSWHICAPVAAVLMEVTLGH